MHTQLVSIWRIIKNAHSTNETLRHKTSTTGQTTQCTEFRILPWNPIVAVPTRQTIIGAVSARRPHPCPLSSQQHIVLFSPLQLTKAGVLNWLQFSAHELLPLTVNGTCRRRVGGIWIYPADARVYPTTDRLLLDAIVKRTPRRDCLTFRAAPPQLSSSR